MPYVINGVPCTIYLGPDADQGITESYAEDGPKATVILQCFWDARHDLMDGLRGGIIAGTRQPPAPYPDGENLYCLRVTSCVGVKPYERPDGWVGYALARITAEFGIPLFDFEDHDPGAVGMDPSGWAYATTSTRTSCEVFSPPTGAYYWVNGPDAGKVVAGVTAGILRPKTEYAIKVHWMKTGHIDGIENLEGTVNEDVVQIGKTYYAPGTLLFISANIEPSPTSFGGRTWDYEYILIGNGPITDANGDVDNAPTWNQFLGRDALYHTINSKADGTGARPYGWSSFWSKLPR